MLALVETPAIPSRDFMVRQAVLNAALRFADPGREPGYLAKSLGVVRLIRCLISGDYVRKQFVADIRHEFVVIAAQYGVTVL